MKKWSLFWVVVTMSAFSAVITSQTPSGHALFEQALAKERVEGNLPEAIRLYERVAAEFASDRVLAARALVQVGLCYEKLGREEAVPAYERVVRDFPDQADTVAQARARLSALARASQPPASAAMTVRTLTDLGNNAQLMTVSADGTRAIVSDFSKGQNIALLDFSTMQRRLVTDYDYSMGYAYYAVWSPDMSRVAHLHANYQTKLSELKVTTLDGRSTVLYRTECCSDIQPVAWTPDGATLLVVMERPDKTWAMGTLPAAGGAFTQLRSFGWSYNWRDAAPRLSPDGRFIAYVEGETGRRDVHVLSLDGRDALRITDDPADDMAPVWSPDGRHLAFTSNRLNSVAVWTVGVSDGRPVGPPLRIKDGMQATRLIDWSERGIFYEQQINARDLYTVAIDPAGGQVIGVPRQIPYSRTGRNVSPTWSPDGKRLAFVSSAAAEPDRRYVVVMPADGGQVSEFLIPTTQHEYQDSPSDLRWFHDGRGLGFSGRDTRGGPAVFRLRLETGEWDTIPLPGNDPYGYGPRVDWNRDGSAFYVARRGQTNAGIFERSVKDGAERPVYRSSFLNLYPLELSPDRKWLAFQQFSVSADGGGTKQGTKQILIVDVATGDIRTLFEIPIPTDAQSEPKLVGWTPSGDVMIDRREAGGAATKVLLVPVNGGASRSIPIPTFAPAGSGETQPTDLVLKWSPDGRAMVLGRVVRGRETLMIEHPLAALRTTTASR